MLIINSFKLLEETCIPKFSLKIFSDLKYEVSHNSVECSVKSLSKNLIHALDWWSRIAEAVRYLKVQSFELYNNNYMIPLTQIANTENFAFISVLVFKLLSQMVFFVGKKDNRNC